MNKKNFFTRLRAVWKLSRHMSNLHTVTPDNRKAIIVVTAYAPDQVLAGQLRELLNENGIRNPLLLLRQGVSVESVPEDYMRRHGWHRKPSLRA